MLPNSLSYKQLDIAEERINEGKYSSIEKRQRDRKYSKRSLETWR